MLHWPEILESHLDIPGMLHTRTQGAKWHNSPSIDGVKQALFTQPQCFVFEMKSKTSLYASLPISFLCKGAFLWGLSLDAW